MKKFLLYFGGFIGCILFLAYLAFLFILPNKIDLTPYVPEIQKLVKDQANIDLYIQNPKISTNWLLQAGIKTDNITAKLPDGSTILDTDGVKVRISLPNLLLLTVKVSCLEIKSPKINLEIINDEQFKIVRLVEDILNKKKNEPAVEKEPLPFDISIIKIKVPKTKISNYKVSVNDLKSGNKLSLEGDILNLAYFNGKTAKVKTNAILYNNENENIILNIDIDTFIPKMQEKDKDDDPAEKIEIPFTNPVTTYRNYNLQSNVNTKVKLRQDKYGKLKIKGYTDVENITMNLSGLQLPYSNINAKFSGNNVDFKTNIAVTDNQQIDLFGKIFYGKNPNFDINLNTDKIYFNDMIILAKAFMDTLHIKNNLASLSASGYWISRCHVKSDFKNLKSNGAFIARDGYIRNGRTNLVFDKIRANLIFEDNKLEITDTQTLVNDNILSVKGNINTDAYSDIKIHSEKLPLPGLFLAFAPRDLRNSISLTSGTLSVDANIQGVLKAPLANANLIVSDLSLNNSSVVVNNEKLVSGFVTDLNTIDGILTNKNLRIILPQTNSSIVNPNITIKLSSSDINISPAKILINKNSEIKLTGDIKNYSKLPEIMIAADGGLDARDLRQFAGREAEPFIAAAGKLPVKAQVSGNDRKQEITLQLKSDSNNYITPVDIQTMTGQQSILQAKIFNKKDGIQIRKTGFYTDVKEFTDDLDSNLNGAKPIAELSGTIVHTNTQQPFINMIKLTIPEELQCKFAAFGHSAFKMAGDLLVFGKSASPVMRGNFRIFDLSIPEIYTFLDSVEIGLLNKDININVNRLQLNGSDLNINLRTDINPRPIFTILRLMISSNNINLDTITKVPEALSRYTAPPQNNGGTTGDIPVLIRNGRINLRSVKTGNIILTDTTGRISLRDNNFYLNNLDTSIFDGRVNGDIVTNLSNMAVDVKTQGHGLNVEKALSDSANVKDALTGTMEFDTDLLLDVKNPDDIMKNIKGIVTFTIFDGQ